VKHPLLLAVSIVMLMIAACSPASQSSATVQNLSPSQYVADFSEAQTAHLLVDVRTPEEYASGHIAGSVNIPLQELQSRMSEIPSNQAVVLYCRSGNRSGQAATLLRDAGYTQIYDLGGIIEWTASGLPVQ
jgi:rhodanese-related sulfurtransferase